MFILNCNNVSQYYCLFDENYFSTSSVNEMETKSEPQTKTQVHNKSRGDIRNYLTEQVSAIFLLAKELGELECQHLLKPQLTDR